jgi:conjugal transfer mating pair stabilization protein TraG
MYEVFTLGGGTYLVDIFNAVAALSSGNAFANIIRITAAFSLLWLMFQTAFGGSWMTNVKWYMAFLAIYLVLFTPKVTVHVTDRLNPALAGGTIDNVPYGLAAFASMTSEIGDGLTRLSEATFSLPNDLRYQETGMLFGARLLKEATKWQITDSRYSGNMTRFARQCVFYGILLGQIDLDELKKTDDLWRYIETTAASPLRHFEYRSAVAGGEQRDIVSCQDGVGYLASQWPQELNQASTIFGTRLFPGVPAATARAELLSRLPIAHNYLIGASRDAGEIMQQQMLINAFDNATKGWAEELGNAAALEGYMRARADLQTEAVYKTTGLQAEKWVPILKIVFEALYYGAFPVALIMMLTPIGLTVVRGYFSGFVWLQSWGPLYAILHRIMMGEAAEKATSISGGDSIAMVTQLGIRSIIQDTSAMAGYLSMSVPFLALGLMFGASRFAHLATSMLAPTQRAAGTAAEEGTSGNISLANTSMDNHSFHTLRGNSMQTNALIDTGMVSSRMGDGAMNHRTADGGESIFKDRAFSDPGFNVSWGSRVSQGLQERSSEARSHAVTQAERASESMGASLGHSLAFSNTLQNSEGFNKSEGLEQRQIIANSASNIEQASERLSETTGWSQQQSLRMLGRAAVDLGTPLKGIFGSGVNLQGSGEWAASGASKEDWATVKGIAKEYGVRESFEKLDAASQNLSFSEGQSHLRDQRDSMTASHSEAQSAEKSLNESLNQARSYEEALTAYKEDSGSFNANLNQTALEIGAERHSGNMAEAYRAAKADPRVAQEWADEAVDRYLDRLPINDKTPESLMGDIYGSRGTENTLRHDLNREEITMANGEPGNQIDQTRSEISTRGQSLGSQMTNGAARVGGEVQSSKATTGKETFQKSNQSLPEGALRAGIENPGDAIDEVNKWFGSDDKKSGGG